MPTTHWSGLWAAALCLVPFTGAIAADTWPELHAGVWRIEIHTRSLKDNRSRTFQSEERRCTDPALLFQRYPPGALVAKAGCRFQSTRLGTSRFRIVSACALQDGGEGVARGTVTVKNPRTFEAVWDTRERGVPVWREDINGQWIRTCGK